ncbi:hypothetical protein FACS189475_00750 [Betaproteobacteria bacterium]|nr:hypothetical protein FACS189475_00750 [Betaproteobacteria bacterium]
MNANSPTFETERFRFVSQALPDETLHVVRFKGSEGLNELFSFTIDLVSQNTALDIGKLLSDRATFRILREDGREAVFCGYPAKAQQSGYFNGYSYYTVELRPTFWKMTQIVQSWIFLEQTLKDTVQELLRSQKFFTFPHKMEFVRNDYPKRDFAMQYDESIYDYLCWRLEDQGAYYYFVQSEQEDTVCFADGPIAHSALPDDPVLTYSPVSGLEGEHVREILLAFSLTQTQRPRRVVIRSHSWKNPNKPIVGMADVSSDGLGDVYLTDEDVESDADATRLARIRAEALRCRERVFSGESSIPGLRPGYTFTLKDHYNPGFNQEYLITDVTHEGSQESFINLGLGIPLEGVQDHLFYRNSFHCIEAARPFRPEKRAPRAKIAGVVHAFIDGAKTDARPELDSLGRYKILFPFDISGRSKGKASCWVRMAQPQVGKNSGMSFPLLGGTEVLVSFVDGNPDRPYITGALANAETGALVGNMNSNISGLSTAGGNQLTFNDTAKKQGIDLRTASGSGLFMSSGSLDTTMTNASFVLDHSGAAATSIAGIYQNIQSGYSAKLAATNEVKLVKLIPKIISTVGKDIFNASGEAGAKEMKDAKSEDDLNAGESAALAKTIGVELLKLTSSLFGFGEDMADLLKSRASLEPPTTDYGNVILASAKKSSSSLSVYPNKYDVTLQVLSTLLGMAGTAVQAGSEFKDAADDVDDATPEEAPTDAEIQQANTAATAAADSLTAAQKENPKDEGKIAAAASTKYAADKKLKDLQDKKAAADKTAAKIADNNAEKTAAQNDYDKLNALPDTDPNKEAALEAARQRLEDANAAVFSDSKALKYAEAKKKIATAKISASLVSELLPELLGFILLALATSDTDKDKRGGVLIHAKDANIGMMAQDAIALHSGHGILLRTKSHLIDKMAELYEGDASYLVTLQQNWGSRDMKTGKNFPNDLFNFYSQTAVKYAVEEAKLKGMDFLADSTTLRYMDADYLVQNIGKIHKVSAEKHIIVTALDAMLEAANQRVKNAEAELQSAGAAQIGILAEIAANATNPGQLSILRNRATEIEKNIINATKKVAEEKLYKAQISSGTDSSAIVVQNKDKKDGSPQRPAAEAGIYLSTKGIGHVIRLDSPKTSITMNDDKGLKLEHKEDKKPSITVNDKTIELSLDGGKVVVSLAKDIITTKCGQGSMTIKNNETVIDNSTNKVKLGKFTFDSSGKMSTSGPLSLAGSMIKIG